MAWEQHSHADGETFTADDMNRMEEAIYDGGGYSSKKEWADGNVPGVEGWNRLENGIAAIGSDVLNDNELRNTLDPNNHISSSQSTTSWSFSSSVAEFRGIDLTDDDSVPVDGGLGVYSETSGTTAYEWTQRKIDYVMGQTYTISLYVRTSSDSANFYARNWNNTASALEQLLFNETITNQSWERKTFTWTFNSVDPIFALRLGVRGAGNIEMCGFKLEKGATATPYSPALADLDLFTPKTWESEQDENNIINASNANRWEQGISDMLAYREKFGMFEETASASPQSVEESDEVAAPEAEEIE